MAKKSTTPQNDPATLAFSAVEDALKDSVFAGLDEPEDQPAPAQGPRPVQRDGSQHAERSRVADKIAAQAGSVANDDRFQGSRILYGLQSKSSQAPTLIAALVAGGWVLAIILVAMIRHGGELGSPAFFGSNDFIGLVALAVIPVLGFFAISTLIRRAQDLRNAATAVTQAAIRLAEPETTASEKVASVGQAVRREVNALGDGLERALSRAGELEVMIHNEVTALERTYSDNESRMRALIQELASQREAVITNTERVREAITESHTGLVFDLDMISQRIAGTIVESGGNLTKALETAGNSLNSAFGERTESFVSLIDQRTSHLLTALDDSASRLNITLEDRANTISMAFENRTMELSTVIDGRMASLTEALDSRAVTLSDAIDNRTSSLAKLLSQGGITLLDQLRDRGHEVSGALDMIGTRIASDITSRAREAEQLLGGLSRQLDESVQVQVNSMESRLQTAMIELSGALDDTTERARVTLMGAGSQNLSQFDSRLDEIAVMIDSRLQTLDGVIGDKGEKLITALDKTNSSFAARANVLEMALDEKSGHFNDIVTQRTREMTETLGQRAKQITETISTRSQEIGDSLEGHAQVIADALDGRTQLLNETLQTRTGELADALATRVQEVDSAIASRTGELDQTLARRSNEIDEAMDRRIQSLDGQIGTHANALDQTLATHATAIDQALFGRVQEIDQTIAARASDLQQSLSGRAQEFDRTLSTRTEALDSTLEQRTKTLSDTLDQRTQELAVTVGTRSSELSEALNTRTQQLADTLGSHTVGIAAAIGDRTTELARTIDAQGTAARDKIDQSLRSVSDTMTERAQSVSTLIASKVGEVNENLGRGIDNAILRIADAESGVSARIDGAAATVGDSARTAADIIETGVNAARKAITDMVDQRLGTLPEAITARADITAERLASLNTAINTALVQSMTDLEAGADRIEETISKRIVAATATISDDVSQTADRMDVAVRNALEQIGTASRTIDELISIKAVAAADAIGGKVAEINRTVSEQTDAFAALVTDKSAQLEMALLNHNNILTQALSQNARDAEDLMSQSTARILTDVTAALGKLNDSNILLQKVLDASTANLSQLETSVAEQTSTYSSTVRDAISSTEEAGRLVTEHVGALQTTIAAMVQEFGSVLGNLNAEASSIDKAAEGLNTASNFTLGLLDERRGAMDALATSFTARADDIDERMRGFAQSIADTVNDTERRLLTARKTMEEMLETTTTTVAETLEQTSGSINIAMNETTGQLHNVLTSTAEQVQTALSGTTAQVEQVLSGTTARLEGALSDTTAKLEGALDQTTAKLETVLNDTTTRVQSALEDTTGRVQTALSSSTQQMQGALSQTTNLLEAALGSTSEKVSTQLGQFTSAASAESDRAADALRQTQQTMILEMQQALEEATQRFNETATAMRATAKEVGSELESTRSELARGVMELPEETRASAAAMRRVVAEQIEALSELNAIVRAQPATHDLNDGRRSPPPSPRREEPRREERREEPRPEPVREAPAARVEPVRPAPAPVMPRPAPVAAATIAPARPAPAPTPAPAPAAAVAAKSEEGGGWLRDVLRNASATAQSAAAPAAAAPAQPNLTNLTDEIARSMDQNALADAWARYQAGEQNVFSRRIYTLSGQGTYDQVRKRLQADAEFAKTSATYMGEFEQLLQQAAQAPNPAAAAREFLLSDRGKVYTMLAHASGRVS